MILIDQHGQWLLIIHSSYVVLIMIKLELLESEGLEYYLLEFDQGGICGESANKTTYLTYPIAFANTCFTMCATSMIEQYKTNAWAKSVNKTQFISGLDNDYNGFYTTNAMTYVAIGY